jgi:hypothetical protein
MTTFSYKDNFISILCARKIGDKEAIHEASLGRIWHHAQKSGANSFAMLTSWRQNLDKKENQKRFSILKSQVRNMGLGFNVLTGHWRECQDSTLPYDQCPEDQLVDAVEPSLFITGISMEQATNLGNDWDQDAVVFSGPETNGDVNLLFRDGSKMELGKFSPMSIAQAYSELKGGRTFRFEYLEWPTQGNVESLMEQTFRSRPLSVLTSLK